MTGDGFRALVAGVGNVLRGDDGFGVRVVEALEGTDLPEGTEVIEVGIGGIHLVQQLMHGRYDALVIVDAVDRDGSPGQLFVLEAEVPDVLEGGRPLEVDMHKTDPSRVLLMARALGALPPCVRIVGCQPASAGLDEALSAPVQAAVGEAVSAVQHLLARWYDEYRQDAHGFRPGADAARGRSSGAGVHKEGQG